MKREKASVSSLMLPMVLALVLSAITAPAARAADWPSWLGPNRDGKTTDENFNANFPKGGAKQVWSADIGVGFTGVTIADGMAYTAGWDNGKTTFFCFDAKTGKKKWSHSFPTKKYDNLNVGGPSGTPAADGDHVYHQARDGKLLCYQAKTGKVVWEKDMARLYDVNVPRWGFSGSPVILGDLLYIDIGKTVALNKKTGTKVWATKDFGPAYSTPAPFTHKGTEYLAVFPKSGLHILKRGTGEPITHFPWKTSYGVHAATPVVVDGNTILISSEYNTGCAVLKFDGSSLKPLWENKNLQQKMGTSVYHDGYFYGFQSTKLACVDAKTGKEMWTQRGLGHGTIIMAGDTLVILSDKGELLTAKASPKSFDAIGKTDRVITGDSTIWTAPSLANGLLYVRGSRGKLVCIDVSK